MRVILAVMRLCVKTQIQQGFKFLVEGDQLCYTLRSLNRTLPGAQLNLPPKPADTIVAERVSYDNYLEGSMKFLVVIGRVSLTVILITLINPTVLLHSAQAAPQPQRQAIAQITSPTDGQTLTGLVTVTGSADHPDFARWELAYGPDPNPNDAWQPFADGKQSVHDGTIGTWNTGVVADGGYMLRLRVVRKDSNYDEAFVRGLKVSNTAPIGTPTSIPPAATFPAEQATFSAVQAAQPLATIMVEQPPTSAPEARPVQTNQPQTNAAARRTNTAAPSGFDARQLSTACLNGVLVAVGLFLVLGVIQAGRWGVKQLRRSLRRRL